MNTSEKNLPKSTIIRHGLPSELMNELFASMLLENAFCLLTKMPNGLLAKNIQKMIESIKMAMKNNKLNEEDCEPVMIISDGGLVVNYSRSYGLNSVRALLPIPAFNLNAINRTIIVSYFEIEILKEDYIIIWLCKKQFQLECRWLGCKSSNKIFSNKARIWIDGELISFENDDECFKEGNVVGLGIIHLPNSSLECFATCNGKFLGKAALPSKFVDLELFPAFTLNINGYSIRVNFGKNEWKFKGFGRLIQ